MKHKRRGKCIENKVCKRERERRTQVIIVASKLAAPRVLPEVMMIHMHLRLYRGINIITTQEC